MILRSNVLKNCKISIYYEVFKKYWGGHGPPIAKCSSAPAFNSVLAVLPQVNHLNTISLTKIEKGIATITTYLISFTYYNRSHVNVFFM